MDHQRHRAGTGESPAGDAGFSLPVVLWSLLLATLLVVGFLAASRTSIRITSNAARNAEAAALAEAGISIAVLDLVEASRRQGAGRRVQVDGTPATCRMPGGARLTLTIEDEAGKIDLNRADDNLLRYVLVGVGHSLSEASSLADRIIDYRDRDGLRRLNGAESEDYLRAGRTSGPADGPFLRVEELAQVLDMPARTVERLLPIVTIDSASPGIDLSVAPADLVRVLNLGISGSSGLDTAADTSSDRAAVPLPPVYRVRSSGVAYLVRAMVVLSDGSEAEVAVVVDLVRKRTRAYEIRRWFTSGSIWTAGGNRASGTRDIGTC